MNDSPAFLYTRLVPAGGSKAAPDSMNDSLAFLYTRVHYWDRPHSNLRWLWLKGEEDDPNRGRRGWKRFLQRWVWLEGEEDDPELGGIGLFKS